MLIESFIKDPTRLSLFAQAQSLFHQANLFGVFLELAAQRSAALPSDKPIENAALRSAWHEGYVEALNDLAHFRERYLEQQKTSSRPDFGAAESLLKDGTINQDEYDQLRKSTGSSDPAITGSSR